ncbi:Short-chain dehydrogenase [Austwickia chelonae]|uniref:Putative oxidoreductase n=1 Tax=Austwickia chelonae NBRC 105200 TaxID=1184607 RepID=K6UMD1_9MICO|nr:SDR family NAD(P)-dependent oxidoreductase [Austwickia chelonae]GAB78011.1 putative oxidoreductase [Austwickia chelonae NBRC 105200]SEV94279.1 Short-chain dehydrogenase [Austwickia chelonae]
MVRLPSFSAALARPGPLPPSPVAVVVGASRGLGLLVCRELAARGCRVVGLARSEESLAEARERMRDWGYGLETYRADVTDVDGLGTALRRVTAEVGEIDVAVHVAGVIQVGPAESMTREHYRTCIDIMLWGPINLAFAVLPGMRARRRGRFGVVTSIGGKISVPHLLPYSTAKFGAVGFTEGLRAELHGSGVTATTIVPGLMRTGSHLAAQFTGDQAKEYAWFAPGACLPVVAMDAERAAGRIADGVLAGRGMVVLSPWAQAAVRVAGALPSMTGTMLGLGGRLLPRPPAGDPTASGTVDGRAARAMADAPWLERLTGRGDRAASRFGEQASSSRG